MNAPALITRRSLDELEADLISLSAHINSRLVPTRRGSMRTTPDGRPGAKGEWHFRNASGMKTPALS